jgi:hypothetical protein
MKPVAIRPNHENDFRTYQSSAAKRMESVISDLKRCAKQNEADARTDSSDATQARAVAAEQRRMIAILRKL